MSKKIVEKTKQGLGSNKSAGPTTRASSQIVEQVAINMDSGNASHSISPTVSGVSTISTTLSPNDILSFIKELPTFDGQPSQLDKFITNVEEIIMLIRGTDQTPYGLLLLRAIRNKVIGKADESLTLAGTSLVWDDIKEGLKRLYSSKKSEAILLREMQSLPDNLSLGQLFSTITKIRGQLISSVQGGNHAATVMEAKKQLYNEVALNSFMVALREPLRTIIRLKNPTTIEQAYKFCQVEQTFYYQGKRDRSYAERGNQGSRTNPYNNQNQRQINNRFSSGQKNYNNSGKNFEQRNNPFKSSNVPSASLNNIETEQSEIGNQATTNFQARASPNQPGS